MNRNSEPISRSAYHEYDESLRRYMTMVFSHMGLGLLLTAIVAYMTALSEDLVRYIYTTPLFYVVMFAPLGVALYFSFRLMHLSYDTARALFYVYAFLVGLSFAFIFLAYTHESIGQTFLVCSAMFGSMSLFGYTTRIDLTKFGSFLMMGLIGLVISMFLNIVFFKSSGMQLVFSGVAVLLFTGLTAFDVQRIKSIYSSADSIEVGQKKAIYGAFTLYLDFINLFIHLLHLLGQERRR